MVKPRELVKAGVHWGHLTSRWCPRMASYIWGLKNRIHLIDVSKTAQQLEKSAKFLEEVCAEGKTVLWVGTKKPAQEVIRAAADRVNMPYVNHRWVGGTLSNFAQVKKSVTKLLHYEDVIARAHEFPFYTKKDLNIFQKCVDRLKKSIGGIRNLKWPIGAVVLVDVSKERSALKEAVAMGIPVVGIVDTNSDPSLVDYVIPANDDTPSSIKIIIDYLAQAAEAGKARAKQEAQDAVVAAESLGSEALSEDSLEEEEETVAKKKAAAPARKPRSENKSRTTKAERPRTEVRRVAKSE